MDKRFTRVARPFEILIGALFIFSAAMKLQDVQGFFKIIHSYHVLDTTEQMRIAALSTLGLEMFLGTALIFALRMRYLVLGIVELVLIAFTGLVIYAWQVHGLEECGCMGKIPMTPLQTVIKNFISFWLLYTAWVGFLRQDRKPGGFGLGFLKFVVCAAAAAGTVVYAYPHLYDAPPKWFPTSNAAVTPHVEPATSLFGKYVVTNQAGEEIKLGEGEHLVAVLSMTCEHCMATVPLLNELVYMPDIPPLAAVCYEPEPGDMGKFRAATSPQFPMLSLGDNFLEMADLIGDEPPRLSYVVNGEPVLSWDEPFPSVAEIVAAIANARNGN